MGDAVSTGYHRPGVKRRLPPPEVLRVTTRNPARMHLESVQKPDHDAPQRLWRMTGRTTNAGGMSHDAGVGKVAHCHRTWRGNAATVRNPPRCRGAAVQLPSRS